jgi:hypothetical protein
MDCGRPVSAEKTPSWQGLADVFAARLTLTLK